jgi:hypothetical protein
VASPKLSLLPCGHFAARGEQCSICAERAQAERVAEIVAATPATAVGPDPTDATATTAVATAPAIGKTEPVAGVYDLPDSIYHADPLRAYGTESLSASSVIRILPPSTPAHYRWWADHPKAPTAAMILGGAVHAIRLGTADLAIFDGASWTSKAGKEFLAAHDPDGDEAPILASDVPAARAMAQALRDHPIVSLGLTGGAPERALFARHADEGVWLRGKVDYLAQGAGGRLVITDIKTAEHADEESFSKAGGDLGYDVQAAGYEYLARTLGLGQKVTVIFAVVEKTPPYLVAVHEFHPDDIETAREAHAVAVRRFARCLESGRWPGYPNRINRVSLPPWAVRTREAATEAEEE